MRINFRFIPGLRHFRLDNGPLLIGIAAVAAVFQAIFLFSLFLETPTRSTAAADTAPLRVISAATRGVIAAVPGDVPCSEQTWPYLDKKCLNQAAEKRPSHGARTTDLNAPPEEVGAILRAAAPGRDLKVAAKRDSFNDRFWPGPITNVTMASIKPSTTGVAPKPPQAVAPKPAEAAAAPKPPEATPAPETRTLVARPAREIRRPAVAPAPAQTRTAATPAAAREIRSDIVQGPDGRQWKRTTYSAPVAGGGTKTFQITRPLQQSYGSWGTFARGF